MIRGYAIDPDVAAGWGDRTEYRYFVDKFGPGTPRALLTLRTMSKWRRAVFRAAKEKGVGDSETKRLDVLLGWLGQCQYRRRNGAAYDGNITWLENAVREYERCAFAGILSRTGEPCHPGVINPDILGDPDNKQWHAATAETPARQPKELVAALAPMLNNCNQVRVVDPYFCASAEHWSVLFALARQLSLRCGGLPDSVEIHCNASKSGLYQPFGAAMRERYRIRPLACSVRIIRWDERADGRGERFHNRYVMTDMGGVTLGGGMEKGQRSQREDINLMSREQYQLRWDQYDERWREPDADGPFTWRDELCVNNSMACD